MENVDDVSGMPRALIRIAESNGALLGRIEKVFPAAKEDPRQLTDNGNQRDVHGCIGVPMLGRSQSWLRLE